MKVIRGGGQERLVSTYFCWDWVFSCVGRGSGVWFWLSLPLVSRNSINRGYRYLGDKNTMEEQNDQGCRERKDKIIVPFLELCFFTKDKRYDRE